VCEWTAVLPPIGSAVAGPRIGAEPEGKDVQQDQREYEQHDGDDGGVHGFSDPSPRPKGRRAPYRSRIPP
jgi:hypothetical protein